MAKREKRRLEVVEPASSLRKDGGRNFVHPADVRGRFVKWRYAVFAALIAFWALLPWVEVGGHPAFFLDVDQRRFYLFGGTFNAQDVWLVFFIMTGVGLALFVLTALLGRVWCGWACPQTVFMEGVFRRIERLVEGPRTKRMRRNAGPWTFDKAWRKLLKHVLFIVAAAFVAHIFLSFFVSMPSLLAMMQGSPEEHPTAFGWVAAMTLLFYGNFAWFREQLCMVICPYGRLQSVLTDRDSLVVGYDTIRGEPRGKASDAEAGDCVDCGRCVNVCPTGIDIRNGLQLECIGCTACIDACDEIMDKLERPRGLVRYDSLQGLEHHVKKLWRPRLILYAVAILAWGVGASFAFSSHTTFEANVLRLRGAPYHLIDDGRTARNLFQVHLINKASEPGTFHVEVVEAEGHTAQVGAPDVTLGSLESREISVLVDVDVARFEPGSRVHVRVSTEGAETRDVSAQLLAPRR